MKINILEKVTKALAERKARYGSPINNHAITAEFWTTYIRAKFKVDVTLTYEDVCFLMILQKTSRQLHSFHEDNLIDIVGFSLNLEDCINDEEEYKKLKN